MATVSRSQDNIFPIPMNCTVNKKTGYVLANLTNEYASSNSKGKCSYSTHKKIGIGYAVDPTNWKDNRFMYANKNYFLIFDKENLPERPARDDHISVGTYAVLKKLCDESGLLNCLVEAFGSDDANLILDLASYMLIEESAKFQHYPHWARKNILFSNDSISDSSRSSFLNEDLSVSKINFFKDNWATRNLGDQKVYVCYDSTNVNSQAEGVFLVQKGYAKDDKTLNQVNSDYVVRQADGLPLTFMNFPGSVTDVTQAPEMIKFFSELGEDVAKNITMICDRGYISERNVKDFDDAGIDFLLMLRKDLSCGEELLKQYSSEIKKNENYLPEYDEFAMTVEGKLFDGKDEPLRNFILIWNHMLEAGHRTNFYSKLVSLKKELDNAINRKTKYSLEEIKKHFYYLNLEYEQNGTMKINKRGKGHSGETEEIPAFIIKSYQDNHERINEALSFCGYRILVSSCKTNGRECRIAYSKRNCVERVFTSLKSSLGMDVIGVYSDDSIHGKSLIWFVASIMYALISIRVSKQREKDRKNFTVPAVVRSLQEISADRNLNTSKYTRRYKLDKRQKNILAEFKINENDIDEIIDKV